MERNYINTPLFIEDSKKKPRVWEVRTNGADVIVSYGLVGGKIAQKVTTSKAKNIGKKNETTPEQQAMLDAQSKWNAQVDREDYNPDIKLSGLQLRPMLARDYNKVSHQVGWGRNWACQPKLDGLRFVIGNRYECDGTVVALTRKGEVEKKVPHIVKEAEAFLNHVRGMTEHYVRALDGELYLHGMTLNEIKKARGKPEGDKLEFHMFDLVIEGMPFDERIKLLYQAMCTFDCEDTCLDSVPTVVCDTEEMMKDLHKKWCGVGYEGAMIRSRDSMYGMADRPDCLYKYKEFFDDEAQIVSWFIDDNGCLMFEVELRKGKELSCGFTIEETVRFNCTPKRTHDVRQQWAEDAIKNTDLFVGDWIKVKYQGVYEDTGKLEFPVGLEFRKCDEDGNVLE